MKRVAHYNRAFVLFLLFKVVGCCDPGQFECTSSECIPDVLKCDGSEDCADSSDEINCTKRSMCRVDQFECLIEGDCIPLSKHCDGTWDCQHGTDEMDCQVSTVEVLSTITTAKPELMGIFQTADGKSSSHYLAYDKAPGTELYLRFTATKCSGYLFEMTSQNSNQFFLLSLSQNGNIQFLFQSARGPGVIIISPPPGKSFCDGRRHMLSFQRYLQDIRYRVDGGSLTKHRVAGLRDPFLRPVRVLTGRGVEGCISGVDVVLLRSRNEQRRVGVSKGCIRKARKTTLAAGIQTSTTRTTKTTTTMRRTASTLPLSNQSSSTSTTPQPSSPATPSSRDHPTRGMLSTRESALTYSKQGFHFMPSTQESPVTTFGRDSTQASSVTQGSSFTSSTHESSVTRGSPVTPSMHGSSVTQGSPVTPLTRDPTLTHSVPIISGRLKTSMNKRTKPKPGERATEIKSPSTYQVTTMVTHSPRVTEPASPIAGTKQVTHLKGKGYSTPMARSSLTISRLQGTQRPTMVNKNEIDENYGATGVSTSTSAGNSINTERPPNVTQTSCERLKSKICLGFGYNDTILPNHLNHKSQGEAMRGMQRFLPFIRANCSTSLKALVCAAYFPRCTKPQSYAAPPCRELCERSRDECARLMDAFGFAWPRQLRCEDLPRDGLAKCEMNRSQKAVSVRPTQASTSEDTTTVSSPSIVTGPVTERYCGTIYTVPAGFIVSPNYPQDYPSNSHCRWAIMLPRAYHVIDIVIESLLLEDDRNCMYDFVVIMDGLYNQVGPRLCGTLAQARAVAVKGNMAVVVFKSDNANSKGGFLIKYRAHSYP
ncbi:uncharacterized protein LOC5502605 isoform X2 [Nematostella vectensis]|uniref:uncharacterized protein LOC5502605 isoform X2 n=1 Tax=Nematostella vectensis TaxID=45351 RepID=UPI0020778DAD|nr:uncharacterized protein LOC5502605 isoform X2 [Nematostella vectensis]